MTGKAGTSLPLQRQGLVERGDRISRLQSLHLQRGNLREKDLITGLGY